jgi:MFS transporter, PPP family, 3-phenylpropionic acid transporter
MPSLLPQRGFSPELRASLFHFWVFGSTGVASVYFAIWLSNRGITADEIGVINAAPVLCMMLINLFIGRLADRASDWKHAIVILALIAGAVPIGLFFVSGFWGILLIWTLCVVPAFSIVPVVDTATLRMALRNGTDFGFIRAWGTVGYMVTTLVSGPLIAWLGDGAFLPLFLAFSAGRALFSLQLPRFRAAPGEEVKAPPAPAAKHLREVLKPWFVLPLVGLALHQSIHGVLSIFGALLWKEQGIPEGYIGVLIAVMAFAEATMMFGWRYLRIKVSARHLIVFAAAVAGTRWIIMAFAPPLWLLFILQLFHCITYAVAYFGGMQFIATWTSEDIAAEAQSFAFALQQGISIVALIGFGWLVALYGPGAWLGAAVFAFTGVGLTLLSLRMQPVHAAVDR